MKVRQRKFLIGFGFASQDGIIQGLAKEKEMRQCEIEYALGMVDPFKCDEWIADIQKLRSRGDHCVITTESAHQKYGKVMRIIIIKRI